MAAAGLDVRVDEAGNLVGRLEGTDPAAGTLLLGSHLDSVRDADAFDGPLGVLAAVACVERLRAEGTPAALRGRRPGVQRREGPALRHRLSRQPGGGRELRRRAAGTPRRRRRKRRYGTRRSRLKGHDGARTTVGWNILTYNLDTLAIRTAYRIRNRSGPSTRSRFAPRPRPTARPCSFLNPNRLSGASS
jgi:hypothetical protein